MVSDYIHLVVEHSASLIRLHEPLGFWSQQGFEAAHKVFKASYSRNTSHDGGRSEDRRSSAYQIIVKCGRVILGDIRNEVLSPSIEMLSPWQRVALSVVELSDSERQLTGEVQEKVVRRVARLLPELPNGRH